MNQKSYEIESRKITINHKGKREIKIKRTIITTSSLDRAKKIAKTWNKGTAWKIYSGIQVTF